MYYDLEIGEEVYELLQELAKEEYEAAIAEMNTELDVMYHNMQNWGLEDAA